MQNPFQITFHDIAHHPEVEELIRRKFERVEAELENVTKCHVVVEKQSKHHQKANEVVVRLDLKISHFEDLVISQKCYENMTSLKGAVNFAFKSGLNQAHKLLKRHVENKRISLDEAPVAEEAEVEDEA